MPEVNWKAKYWDWDCWDIMKPSPGKMVANAIPAGMGLVAFATNTEKWSRSVPS